MAGRDSTFFEQLGRLTQGPWLRKIDATIRFDITEDGRTRHWMLAIRDGAVTVTSAYERADTVVRANRAAVERLSRGELRLIPAWLRNEITVEGHLLHVLILERMLEAPGHEDVPLRGVARRR
jgi:putative sterol carrier protein